MAATIAFEPSQYFRAHDSCSWTTTVELDDWIGQLDLGIESGTCDSRRSDGCVGYVFEGSGWIQVTLVDEGFYMRLQAVIRGCPSDWVNLEVFSVGRRLWQNGFGKMALAKCLNMSQTTVFGHDGCTPIGFDRVSLSRSVRSSGPGWVDRVRGKLRACPKRSQVAVAELLRLSR